MDAKIFRVNYKSDFILTLISDAGWMTPFCIKFWTGAPSQAYYAQYDGTTYTNCAPVDGEPTKLTVQFDDHHLPIGDLKYQVAYHFTVADFPNDTEDEVLNQANITTEIDGETYQVMLDFTGETAPEIQFSLPAYANEAQRIANELQRESNELQREANEEDREANELNRQRNEGTRIENEQERVREFGQMKGDLEQATRDASAAAENANEKAVYAKNQGDYAKQQGDYAKDQGDIAKADHLRAEEDHRVAGEDHTQAGNDHTRAGEDHTQAGNDHTRAGEDHTQAGNDHTRADQDHTRAESDHEAVEVYVDSLGAFDLSKHNAVGGVLATYADLDAALTALNALESKYKYGGMSLKYVHTYDNKYVQFRCMAQSFTTDVTQWQGIDDEPTAGSDNLIKSNGVYLELYGNNPIVTVTAKSTSSGSYHDILFDAIIPAGSIITEIDSIFGYFLKTDGTYDVSISVSVTLPYTTLYDYKGIKTNNAGDCSVTYNNGTVVVKGLKKEIEEETLNVNFQQGLSSEQKQTALSNLGLEIDSEPIKNSHNPIESGAVYHISEEINGNKKIKYISSVNVPSHSGYETFYFDNPFLEGDVIEMVYGNVFGYAVKEDGTADTSISLGALTLPYTVPYKIVGIKTNSSFNVEFGLVRGETVYGVIEELNIYSKTSSIQTPLSADFLRDYYAIKNNHALVSGGASYRMAVYNIKKYAKYHIDVTDVVLVGTADYWMLAGFNSNDFPNTGDDVTIIKTVGAETEYHFDFISKCDGLLFVAYRIAGNEYTVSVGRYENTGEYIDFEKQINVLNQEVEKLSPQIPTINIPDTIHTYVGDTLQLFFKSIVNTINIENYYVRINGSGYSYPRYYEVKPKTSGNLPIVVEVRNNKDEIIASKSATIVVHSAPSTPVQEKKIAIFGDSLTQGGQYPNELKRLLTSDDEQSDIMPAGLNLSNISFIGTMGNDAKYYGIGGWGWNNYAEHTLSGYRFYSSDYASVVVGSYYYLNKNTANEVGLLVTEVRTTDMSFAARITSGDASNIPASGTFDNTNISYSSFEQDTANPLWDNINNKVSFEYYFNQCGMTGSIDVVTFLLGWNMIFMNFDNYTEDIVTLIETLHTEYPSARMALIGIQLPSLNGGLAYNYPGDAFFSNKENVINKVHEYNDFLSEIAEDYNYVDYIDIASEFDSENNMPEEMTNVNSRNNKKEYRGTNGVHPAIGGYYQIADAICRYLINVL